MKSTVKQEKKDVDNNNIDLLGSIKRTTKANNDTHSTSPIEISSASCSNTSSSSSSFGDDDEDDLSTGDEFLVKLRSDFEKRRELSKQETAKMDSVCSKKRRVSNSGVDLRSDFLSALPKKAFHSPLPLNFVPPPVEEEEAATEEEEERPMPVVRGSKQFWKAGDYDGGNVGNCSSNTGGMDHLRVHPKFLHSNATSHKWALGAFAELLDNAMDEVCNGATYVNVDMLRNKKDSSHMLLVQDNGGGMTPDKLRQCMSLGYSVKSKMANTIGQYGNGFKTSTMRLGADVIVFSRCQGDVGQRATQSIGMLSYSYLRGTAKEDIVVPMIDYEKKGKKWNKIIRSSQQDWDGNLETIVQWTPCRDEEDLLRQFDFLKKQGTRIIIYNLWEDDEGNLELDFDSEKDDIQIRGVNRDEKNIEMAQKYRNCRHFLTYRHSLRIYASILYLRLPPGFRIILRGKDVEHHNIINDMMLTKELTYRPSQLADGVVNNNMYATVTIGFVKDAKHHIDIQGFNIYHKNRLIKPFWRLWNAAGSDGRGIIGVLEANFVEPAHDKQSFERTPVLARLENRLIVYQKDYWGSNCQEIGYAPRRHSKKSHSPHNTDSSPDLVKMKSQEKFNKRSPTTSGDSNQEGSSQEASPSCTGAAAQDLLAEGIRIPKRARTMSSPKSKDVVNGDTKVSSDDGETPSTTRVLRSRRTVVADEHEKEPVTSDDTEMSLTEPKVVSKPETTARLLRNISGPKKDDLSKELQSAKDRNKSLESQLEDLRQQLQEARQKTEELNQEQIALIDMLQEETERHNQAEEGLKEKLRDAANTIAKLVEKVKLLEGRK